MAETLPETRVPETGVLIRAENGDVVTYDATGLTLRLSDTVLADLRARLGFGPDFVSGEASNLDASVHLGDLDAWNLRSTGGWLRFTGVLEPGRGARPYQRLVSGGDVISDAPGPLYGLLSLGGARRAGFNTGPVCFRFNVLAPADDIGAVGLEGTAQSQPTAALQHLPHASRDALIADTLLSWRQMDSLGLPLFMVRAETDDSSVIGQLTLGTAYGNFLSAVASLCLAAAALGKTPKVLSVGLEFGLEDLTSTADELAEGLRALMRKIERDLGARGLQRPVFLYSLEAGLPGQAASPAQLAAWELAWSPGPHQLALPAPGYMFAVDSFGRLTDAGRAHAAQMDAHALIALSQRQPWACPLFLLAEYRGCDIKVTAQSMAPLLVDVEDPFSSGPSAGFAVEGGAHPVRVTGVRVDPEDACALIVTCDRAPTAGRLLYAHGGGATGAVRDTWFAPASDGTILHRWAYPVALPLHPGAA